MNIFKKLFKKKESKPTEESIQFYIVVDKDEYPDANLECDEDLRKFTRLTMVSTLEDAEEFILTKVLQDNKTHFTGWCEKQNKDVKEPQSLLDYIALQQDDGVRLLDHYLFLPIAYPKEVLAVYLRLLYDCKPIGCSFESPEEQLITTVEELASEIKKAKKENPYKEIAKDLEIEKKE